MVPPLNPSRSSPSRSSPSLLPPLPPVFITAQSSAQTSAPTKSLSCLIELMCFALSSRESAGRQSGDLATIFSARLIWKPEWRISRERNLVEESLQWTGDVLQVDTVIPCDVQTGASVAQAPCICCMILCHGASRRQTTHPFFSGCRKQKLNICSAKDRNGFPRNGALGANVFALS
jgi:hypothetical protein